MPHERRERPLVLLADEDEMARLVAATALLTVDVDVVVACDGGEALTLFRDLRPDLVLLDVMMPGVDGSSVSAHLAAMSADAFVPLVVMTALDDMEAIDQAFLAGATDFITKPISAALLAHRIRYILRSRRASLELRDGSRTLARAQHLARLVHWEFEPSTQRFRWSASSGQVFAGIEGEGCVRQAWLRWVHPADRARVEDALTRREAHHVEYRLVLPSGEVRIVHQEAELDLDVETGGVRVLGTAQDITELRAAEGEILHLAEYDTLTDLPNRALVRRFLDAALVAAEPKGESVAALSLDLDLFRHVNDSVGHFAGSALLQEVAGRVRALVTDAYGARALVGRLGGDEFVVIVPGVRDEAEASTLFGALSARIAEPYVLDGNDVRISCSGGIALGPASGCDGDTLLMHADAALHAAKARGRKEVSVFTADLQLKVARRHDVEVRLRAALLTGRGLELHYQPKVEVPQERVAGVEALLRWGPDPQGPISPLELIAVAEDAGLVVELGDWVLRTACRQAKAWLEEGLSTLRVAVNVSAHQFREPDFAAKVAGVLSEIGLPPEWLELEITEGVMMLDTSATSRMLADLKRLGVRISLDDFGTGYSSLAYLTCLPIDTLKIDRSFIKEIGVARKGEAIVAAIIALSRTLDIAIVAEGVETNAQRRFLEGYGALEIQGWLFAKAMPGREIAPWIERHASLANAEYLATG
jgi:diguanylate cyclase (GGDEF)-like protein